MISYEGACFPGGPINSSATKHCCVSRLGLYIFGRQSLFANCYEMQPTFKHLLARPTQLALQPLEYWQVGNLILGCLKTEGVACRDEMCH